MKKMLGILRKVVVVMLLMAGTAALTVWFMAMRDRRRSGDGQPAEPPESSGNVMATAATTSEVVASPDGDLDWSREEILSLRNHIGNQTILTLLRLLRERDGAPVNYHELMEQTGRTMPQVRADLAVFSRAVKKIEGHQHWPIDTTSPTDGESRIAYTVPKTYLDWWFEE